MEKKTRLEFIKTTGSVLLVTSGISVFGLFSAFAAPESDDPEHYYSDGYYSDGYSTGIDAVTPESLLLTVFPNPSDGNFHLTMNAKSNMNSDIYIHDLAGKTVSARNYNITEGANLVSFEGLDIARGIYILSVVTEKSADSLRIIIAK